MGHHHRREIVVDIAVHWSGSHVTIHLFHAGVHGLHELRGMGFHLRSGGGQDQESDHP
jgi:hypothetical protein